MSVAEGPGYYFYSKYKGPEKMLFRAFNFKFSKGDWPVECEVEVLLINVPRKVQMIHVKSDFWKQSTLLTDNKEIIEAAFGVV